MRALSLITLSAALLAVSPVTAQDNPYTSNPAQLGIVATTPSRIEGSRREMNRGRDQVWRANMTPSQLHSYAQHALGRGGFVCSIAETALVGQTRDGAPIVEVDCADGGGLIIADTDPIVATDCLDLSPETAVIGRERSRVESCRLPANIASVAAERDAERRQSAARN